MGKSLDASPPARRALGPVCFVPSVLLDTEPGAPVTPSGRVVPQFRWIHCANEGTYKGHHQGEFELTRSVLETFVANFRADPQYHAGQLELDDGKTHRGGVRPVIQFDYEHASEMPAWEGSIAQSGAPACGWVLDVEVRDGPGGVAQLWAFGRLGEQIRGQIARQEYRSVSIAFTLEGVHWVTGKPIGPVLTSIAFTNHPYMRDLEPLAAANRPTSQAAPRGLQQPGPETTRERGSTTTGGTMSDQLRERVCRALNIRVLQDDAAVGDAVEEAAAAAGDLKSLLEALGVAQPDEAMKAIPELRSAREKLAGLLAEIDALLQQDTAVDAEVARADVGAAMRAAKFMGAGAEKALAAFRGQCVTEEIRKAGEAPTLSALREARRKGRERFLSEYGVKSAEHAHLTQTLVAGSGGAQLEPPARPLPLTERGVEDAGAPVIDLSAYKGRNTTEKLIAHLTKTEPGFERLPLDKKIARAGALRRTAQLTA